WATEQYTAYKTARAIPDPKTRRKKMEQIVSLTSSHFTFGDGFDDFEAAVDTWRSQTPLFPDTEETEIPFYQLVITELSEHIEKKWKSEQARTYPEVL